MTINKPYYSYLCINPYPIKEYFIKNNFNTFTILFKLLTMDILLKDITNFKMSIMQ